MNRCLPGREGGEQKGRMSGAGKAWAQCSRNRDGQSEDRGVHLGERAGCIVLPVTETDKCLHLPIFRKEPYWQLKFWPRKSTP